eukprot:276187-Pelagomonas_calceolata.AAC.7
MHTCTHSDAQLAPPTLSRCSSCCAGGAAERRALDSECAHALCCCCRDGRPPGHLDTSSEWCLRRPMCVACPLDSGLLARARYKWQS